MSVGSGRPRYDGLVTGFLVKLFLLTVNFTIKTTRVLIKMQRERENTIFVFVSGTKQNWVN